jgi:hypothetical protein
VSRPETDPLTRDRGNPHDAMPPQSWRCYHCDVVFTNRNHAAEHFGEDESATVACKLSRTDGHFVTLVRELQRELATYRREDNHVLRAWHSREADHADAARRAEEDGYNRGVIEAKKMFQDELAAAERDRDDARRRVDGAVVVMLTMVRRLNLYDSHAKAVADSALQWMKENDCIPSPYRAAPGTGGTTGGEVT